MPVLSSIIDRSSDRRPQQRPCGREQIAGKARVGSLTRSRKKIEKACQPGKILRSVEMGTFGNKRRSRGVWLGLNRWTHQQV